MDPIDPARLGRVLGALRELQGPSKASPVAPSKPPSANAKQTRSTAVLRTRLRQRLQALDPDSEAFANAGPTIAVQEMLMWEFGDEILEHPRFGQVVQSVVGALMGDERVAEGMRKVLLTLGVKPC